MTLRPGDPVVLRYFVRGRPVGALPTRSVAVDGGLVLWLAPDTVVRWPAVDGRHIRDVPLQERYRGPWESVERRWHGNGVVILQRPGQAHSIWVFRDGDRFAGWYVNLEAPWRPWAAGFDTEDHTLDLWVEAGGTWYWKDEDELEVALRVGFYTPEQAEAFRAEGERVVAEWPFPTGWEDWRPDPSWPVPAIPPGWDEAD